MSVVTGEQLAAKILPDGAGRNLFISYARVDRLRIEQLVKALEALGHSVWWDRQLTGGGSFSKEIAAALAHADVVIVGWSAVSVESDWVRDEAANGRDRKRLVPVLLDGTLPPLGFRQTHGIDLSKWKGRANAREIAALAKGIAATVGSEAVGPATPVAKPPARWLRPAVLAAVALAIIAAVVVGWQQFGASAPMATAAGPATASRIAVMPFAAMSKGEDARYFAEGVAEEILDALAKDPALKVIGRSSAWAFRDKLGDLGLIREKLGVGQLLEGSVRQQGDKLRVSVRLIDTRDGGEMWNESFERSATDTFAVQDEIARSVAAKLGSSVAGSSTPQSAVGGVYEKLLLARQLIRTRKVPEMLRARALLAGAIKADPDYAPIHADYGRVTLLLAPAPGLYGGLPSATAAFADAERHITRALALDPRLSEAWYADATLHSIQRNLRRSAVSMGKALALAPNNSELLNSARMDYWRQGNPTRALATIERAHAIDPLWRTSTVNLIDDYASLGFLDKATTVANGFRATSPDPVAAILVDAFAANVTGEYARALKLLDAARARDPDAPISYYREFFSLLVYAVEPASDQLPLYKFKRLLAAGRYNDVATILAADPAEARFLDSGVMLGTALLKLGRPAALVDAFAARFGSPATMAQSGDGADARVPLLLAQALAQTGRVDDARLIRAMARRNVETVARNGGVAGYYAFNRALLLASEGDRAGSLTTLEQLVRAQWWQVCQGPIWPGDTFAIFGLAREPRAQAILATCRAKINEQRKLAGIGPMETR